MVTIDIPKLKLRPRSLVLDAGCGTGRHLRALINLSGIRIIGLDKDDDELRVAQDSLKEIPAEQVDNCLVLKSDINKLPFAAEQFDCVICSEVLEHVPAPEEALKELVRVLKPRGMIVISVPRYYPERICWLISSAYYNKKGGHIRIFKKKSLLRMLASQGITCWKINHRHALHTPYWWLKCLAGLKNEDHWFVKYYKKFLEWDIMQGPRFVRILEELLNPVLGKSIVFYLRKD